MLVVEDICGDEDDTFLELEYFRVVLQEAIYQELLKCDKIAPNFDFMDRIFK